MAKLNKTDLPWIFEVLTLVAVIIGLTFGAIDKTLYFKLDGDDYENKAVFKFTSKHDDGNLFFDLMDGASLTLQGI